MTPGLSWRGESTVTKVLFHIIKSYDMKVILASKKKKPLTVLLFIQ